MQVKVPVRARLAGSLCRKHEHMGVHTPSPSLHFCLSPSSALKYVCACVCVCVCVCACVCLCVYLYELMDRWINA